jgi:hypothetical protein
MMEDLLRIAHVALTAPGEAPMLVPGRRGPIAAALAPGQSLALLPASLLPGIDDSRAELMWLDRSGAGRAASRRLRVGAGRLVWLAAGPGEIVALGDDNVGGDVRRLIAAAYAWAAREPFAEVLAPTPDAAQPSAGVAQGLRLNERIAVRVERTGPQRSLVEVSNRNATPAAGLLLRVYLNTETHDVEVERTTLQQAPAEPSFEWAENRLDLRLPELAAGASQSYTLDIVPRASEAAEASAQN